MCGRTADKVAAGISHTESRKLVKAMGDKSAIRIVSADNLIGVFLSGW